MKYVSGFKMSNRFCVYPALAALLAVLLAACPDVNKPKQDEAPAIAANAGMGNVILSVTETGGRTILPGTPAFTKYEFTFEPLDGQAGRDKVTVNAGGGGPANVELTQGKWNIIAKGYVTINGIEGIVDGSYLAAEGKAENVTVSAGQTKTVSIDLKGGAQTGEKGILNWNISLPQDTASATMTILTMQGTSIKEINLKAQPQGNMGIESGNYIVTFGLNDQPTKTEILHIYSGVTSRVERALYTALSFNNLDDLANWLGNAPDNTPTMPYDIILYGLNVETDFAKGDIYSSDYDSLRLLFDSMKGRYVNIDMSACKGQSIPAAYTTNTNDRPDRDKIVAIKLPAELNSIGNCAFSGCNGFIGDLVIPDGVTSIGWSAFENCSGLTSVTIPDSVTSIGWYAFEGCSGLTTINVNPLNAVYTSVDGILYSKNPYNIILVPNKISGDITIPYGVTSIDGAFYECTGLTSVTIPDRVTYIGYSAFSGCSGLTSITIPFVGNTLDGTSNTHFGYIFGAYDYYNQNDYIPVSLKTVIVTGGTSIGSYAFYRCRGLTSVTIPNSVTSIGDSAFFGCSGLTSVTIGNSVTSIGDEAFRYCSGLTSVTIGDNVTSIGVWAFYNCSGLTSITIPESVTSIGSYAFSDCSGLTAINVSPYNVAYTVVDRILYSKNPLGIIWVPGNISGDITILNGVTSIDRAFSGCASLTGITIPESVTSIWSGAFSGCTGLTSITIPFVGNTLDGTSNTHFGYIFGAYNADYNYSSIPVSLKTVIVTGGTSIGNGAFYGCSGPTSITIPNSITSIGSYAFYGCSGLTSVTIPDSVTSIGGAAFWNCSGLTSITIPDSVISIGSSAFKYCTKLTSVTIGNGVNSIGSEAFRGCSGLTSFTIGNSVPSFGMGAFEGCSGLTSVTIGNSVTSIVGNFSGFSWLTAINVGVANTAYSSENGVLYNKNKTTIVAYPAGKTGEFTIPSSVTSIGNYAFYVCSGLTGVTIPASVTSIGDYAFDSCTGLASVTFDGTIPASGFSTNSPFPGDLRTKYFDVNGWPGTYTTANPGSNPVWVNISIVTWTAIPDSPFHTYGTPILAITYGNSKFIAGGDNGTMAYSSDGTSWTAVSNSTFGTSSIRGIAYGGNKFVAVGASGKMAYSSDGTSWTAVSDSKFGTTTIEAVAYGGSKFVAVGSSGKMAYSSDGASWTAVTTSRFETTDSINAIAYGGSKFVAGGTSGKMAYSSDGISWTAVSDSKLSSNINRNKIAYGSNKFVADAGKMAYSSDGINWTAAASPFSSVNAITYGNNKFAAVYSNRTATSPDGTNWTVLEGSGLANFSPSVIAYGNDKFIAGSSSSDNSVVRMAYLLDN